MPVPLPAATATHSVGSGRRWGMTTTRKPQLLRTLQFPLRLVSEANQREHFMDRHRRKVNQHVVTRVELVAAFHGFPQQCVRKPLAVKLTRIGPRRMDDDNNVGSFKHVQDAVAAFFGVDDGDAKAIGWSYEQELGKPAAVRIEVYGRVTAAGGVRAAGGVKC